MIVFKEFLNMTENGIWHNKTQYIQPPCIISSNKKYAILLECVKIQFGIHKQKKFDVMSQKLFKWQYCIIFYTKIIMVFDADND